MEGARCFFSGVKSGSFHGTFQGIELKKIDRNRTGNNMLLVPLKASGGVIPYIRYLGSWQLIGVLVSRPSIGDDGF